MGEADDRVSRNGSGLIAGDVVFDGVGVLQAGEFDGKAIFNMTDHPAHGLADGDGGADYPAAVRERSPPRRPRRKDR